MRVISKKAIVDYYTAHPDSMGALLAWYERVTSTDWRDFNHLKSGFPSVDFVGNNHYVFNKPHFDCVAIGYYRFGAVDWVSYAKKKAVII